MSRGFSFKALQFSIHYSTQYRIVPTAAIDKNLAFLLHIFDLVVNQ